MAAADAAPTIHYVCSNSNKIRDGKEMRPTRERDVAAAPSVDPVCNNNSSLIHDGKVLCPTLEHSAAGADVAPSVDHVSSNNCQIQEGKAMLKNVIVARTPLAGSSVYEVIM